MFFNFRFGLEPPGPTMLSDLWRHENQGVPLKVPWLQGLLHMNQKKWACNRENLPNHMYSNMRMIHDSRKLEKMAVF